MHTYDPEPPVDDDIQDNWGGFRQAMARCADPPAPPPIDDDDGTPGQYTDDWD